MDDKTQKDHKQIGQEQELFFTDEIAPGAPFWLPKGMIIFRELERFILELTKGAGYQETSTPIMVKSELFKRSGHWTKFGEHNMYNLTLSDEEDGSKGVSYSLKPMNCPESTLIYSFRPRSYRELPLRLSEIGRLHRREKSGEVNGLLRVRQLTMDDAHIYATEEQIQSEVTGILDMMMDFYERLGFEYSFRLATKPEESAGTDENWEKAEKALEEALKSKNLEYQLKEKDGAFYGPKIDVHIKDSLGREWQLATVQVDFHQPEAFDLKYINERGEQIRPVMIHRAILGSFERFTGILIEHLQGAFPLWLSPIQVQIIPVTDRNVDYGKKILEQLKESGIRVESDERSETMQNKIRSAQIQKIPVMIIVGDREEGESKITVRERSGKILENQDLGDFLGSLNKQIADRAQ